MSHEVIVSDTTGQVFVVTGRPNQGYQVSIVEHADAPSSFNRKWQAVAWCHEQTRVVGPST